MDSLLASYGSDDEDELEEKEQSAGIAPRLPAAAQAPQKLSLFGRLPAPRNSGPGATAQNAGSLFASLPPPQSVANSDSSVLSSAADGASQEASRPSLFAKLPPPKVEESTTGYGNPNHGIPSSKISLFAALPSPKVEFDISKVKVEVSNPKAKKQSVAFKPPIDLSILEDDDDDWRPAQKKAKAEPSSMTKSGGGLSSLLPAPKNSLGLGATLGAGPTAGGRRAAMEVVAKTKPQDVNVKTEPMAVNSRISTASGTAAKVEKDAYVSQAQVQYDNSAYAVDQSAAFVPQAPYVNEPYGFAAPQGAYAPAQEMHNVSSNYEQQNWQYAGNVSSFASHSSQTYHAPANSQEVADPIAQVLQAERRRGREDRMAAPNVIEVKQADLTSGKMREDQLRSTGIAFGPAYQPVSSSKDKPSKIQRRKHQIGTLLQDMRQKEMELLDRRAKGSLTKAETQAKYGW